VELLEGAGCCGAEAGAFWLDADPDRPASSKAAKGCALGVAPDVKGEADDGELTATVALGAILGTLGTLGTPERLQ
jgi:hypothetical protein